MADKTKSRNQLVKIGSEFLVVRQGGLLESGGEPVVDLASALVKVAPDLASSRNPEAARQLLTWIVEGLRRFRALPPDWADFVADALEKSLTNPKHAGAAFGLVAKRKRPVSATKVHRDRELAAAVEALRRKGVPLKDGRRDGAYTLAGRQFHTSARTAQRAHTHWMKFIRKFAADLAAIERNQ